MSTLGLDFRAFDADNHYYEAADAFTRHLPREYAKRGVQWVDVDGKRRLMAGGRLWKFIPNPTWDPIARPGSLDDYFRGIRGKAQDIREAFGELERLADHPEYQEADARLRVMDDQGLDGCILFPTLAVGAEQALLHDPEALTATFSAFNRWLEDDWGFANTGRLFAAPLITLADPDWAVAEVHAVAERGAKVICLRAAPAPTTTAAGGRSPGDAVFDPFWSAVEDTGLTVGYHSGDAGYHRFAEAWGESTAMEAFRQNPFTQIITSDRPIFDTMAALLCHGVFARHPRLRVCVIESGSTWVPELFKRLKKAFGQVPHMFNGESPIDTFSRHVWVSPFYEDNIRGLADSIGVGHVLMGSDWPHAEGLADPMSYVKDLAGFDDDEVRAIMRDNGWSLVR